MDIVTIINAHNNPALLKNTIDSVRRWVTDKIIVVIDAAGWYLFSNFKCPENTELVKGVYHNCYRSPYKNIAIGLNYAYAKYPKADWYNYIESDVMYLNDLFKEDLRAKSDHTDLGFIQRTGKQGDQWLVEKIFQKKLPVYFMLGAIHFYSHSCISQLVGIDFFSKVLEETKQYSGAAFPNFSHYAVEEVIYPTASAVFGRIGNLGNYDNTICKSSYGNICERYAVRFTPEISEKEVTAFTSIAHPLKNMQRRINILNKMQNNKEEFLADLNPREATFYYGAKGVIFWKDGQPLESDFPTPSEACLLAKPEARLRGQRVMHGLWAHTTDFGTIVPNMSVVGPASRLVYKLDKKYHGLKGSVGISENAKGYDSTIVFCVLCDGELVWRSQPMKKMGQAEAYQVMVENIETLELITVTIGNYNSCQAIWHDPILLLR